MKVNFYLEDDQGFKWEEFGCIRKKGNVFYENNLVDINFLNDIFKSVTYLNDFEEIVKNINGEFLIVLTSVEGDTFICSDRLNSIKLLYSVNDKNIIISDSYKKFKNKKTELISIEELKLAGYVSGNKTIYKNIKQLQASEMLQINKNKIITKKYNYFIPNVIRTKDEQCFDVINKICLDAFNKLIKSLNGRTAIVPLSGGYDSRFIVLMLKKLKYDNVICYTYGKKNSFEVDISRKVAKELDFKHIFIEYTNETWEETFKSSNIKLFEYCFNGVALPHIQDMYAVKFMKDKNLIPNDSIFIPGHSGDLLGGSHLRNDYKLISEKPNYIDTSELIYLVHYNNVKSKYYYHILKRLRTQLIDIKGHTSLGSSESWNICNRQSKYIVNSVRVYQYYGFEFRIPLWDNELTNYFLSLKGSDRIESILYNEFLENEFKKYKINYQKKQPLYKKKIITKIKNLFPKFLYVFFKKNYMILAKKHNDINRFNFIETMLLKKIDYDPKNNKMLEFKQIVTLWFLFSMNIDN